MGFRNSFEYKFFLLLTKNVVMSRSIGKGHIVFGLLVSYPFVCLSACLSESLAWLRTFWRLDEFVMFHMHAARGRHFQGLSLILPIFNVNVFDTNGSSRGMTFVDHRILHILLWRESTIKNASLFCFMQCFVLCNLNSGLRYLRQWYAKVNKNPFIIRPWNNSE